MQIRKRLDAVKSADRLVEVLRLSDELAVEAGRDSGRRNIRVLMNAVGSADQIAAIAAIHALAHIADEEADTVLADLLSSDQGFVREHAAWALRGRAPRPGSIARLTRLVLEGGFTSMVTQRTLEAWAKTAPDLVATAIEGALLGVVEPSQRYGLVETLGLVPHPNATDPLLRVAGDKHEDPSVRAAAVAALGERSGDSQIPGLLERLVTSGGPLSGVAQLALVDVANQGIRNHEDSHSLRGDGLTVAQLFLHADIDPELRQAGSGDNGGVATLLVRLGDALVKGSEQPVIESERDVSGACRIDRVLTLSRGTVDEAAQSLAALDHHHSGHLYGRVPLLREPMPSANAWPLRVAARRGIARILKAAAPVDIIHLRMADVGSLAAFDVARAFEIPVVFTAAPDPHGLINSMDLAGTLTRQNFGDIDQVEHFWFRARLVQRLASNSAHAVFLPRPNLPRDMKDLMGLDIEADPGRNTTVPEGIDLHVTDQSVTEARSLAAGGSPSAPLTELSDLLADLPVERQGLPLLISVGRFHRVKGTAAVVEAWAGSDLRQRANLLMVGGNLDNPSADERDQLVRIDHTIDPAERMREGLILSGHRPNGTVSRWVAAAHFGVPGLVAANGVYVCGSLKEEFGLAVLEAMASGLLVVAPHGGGPETYVEQGRTGFLTTTWDPVKLTEAIQDALACATGETTRERADHSRSVVQERFTVGAMAEALTRVYCDVYDDDVQHRQELA